MRTIFFPFLFFILVVVSCGKKKGAVSESEIQQEVFPDAEIAEVFRDIVKYNRESKFDSSFRAIDDLKGRIPEEEMSPLQQLSLNKEIAFLYSHRGQFQEAEKYLRICRQIAEENGFDTHLPWIYTEISFAMASTGRQDSSMFMAFKGEHAALAVNDSAQLGRAYLKIASNYNLNGNTYLAIDYFLKALKLAEASNNQKSITNIYSDMIPAMLEIKDYKRAVEYGQRLMESFDSEKDLYNKGILLNNIGGIYFMMGDLDKAVDFIQRSYEVRVALKDSFGISQAYANLGHIKTAMGKYEEASDYLSKSLDMKTRIRNMNGMDDLYLGMAENYSAQGNTKAAKEYFDKVLEMALTNKNFQMQIDIYGGLSKVYEKEGNKSKAYDMIKRYYTLRDSLVGNEKKNEITRKQDKFEYELQSAKEKLITSQKQVLAEEQLKRQRIMIIFSLVAIALSVIAGALFFRSYLIKKRANKQLNLQKAEIAAKNRMLQYKNEEITSSIVYSKTLQENILAPLDLIKKELDAFVLYKPKDIVAGDFYWFEKNKGSLFIAAADCTGHGVPGALTSMICSQKLSSALEKGYTEPSDILNFVNEEVKRTFRNQNRDGMDCALLRIDRSKGTLFYSLANRPLWRLRPGTGGFELEEFHPDKQSIGHGVKDSVGFSNGSAEFLPGDVFYLFSDGFADQFGGPDATSRAKGGKKYSTRRLKELLKANAGFDMSAQMANLNVAIEAWKGDLEQVDDIMVIGIRL